MAQETSTAGSGGFFSFFRGGSSSGAHARVGGKRGPLDGLYLLQLIPTLLIVLLGVVTIWSVSLDLADANIKSHLAGIALGLAAAFVAWRYDARGLANMTTALFILACVLMVLPRVPGLGYSGGGMMGWVRIGPLRFQPSEPSKLVTIFLMAAACAQYNGKIDTFKDYCKLCGTLLVPLVLILSLDLGTGLVIFFIGNPFKGLIISQMVLSVQLPFTVFLQVGLTSSRRVMGEYANSRWSTFVLYTIAVVVSVLNIMLLFS